MKKAHRADIDGLRTFAVLPVVMFHAKLGCAGGFVGVDIFFVISGFLITSFILKDIAAGEFCLLDFWERRIRRILPALASVVLVAFTLGWIIFLPLDFEELGKSAVAQATLLSNVFFYRKTLFGGGYFDTNSDTYTLLHTWSLAVEEQYYLFFPLLLFLVAKYKWLSNSQVIPFLGIISFAACVGASYYDLGAAFYLLPFRAWELMLGAYLAVNPRIVKIPHTAVAEVLSLAGLALILYPILIYTPATRFPGLAAIPPCLGAALIIYTGGFQPTIVGRLLSLKPIVFLGLTSYSIYLWHWPVLVFGKYLSKNPENLGLGIRVGLLVLTLALAVASWRWIETPFRSRSLCPRRAQLIAYSGCSTLFLLVLGLAVFLQDGIPSRYSPRALSFYNSRNDFVRTENLHLSQAEAGQFPEIGAHAAGQPIELIVWGDSHAMALLPAIEELCRKYSVRGVQATHTATAPILEYESRYHQTSLKEQSPAFSRSVVEFVRKNRVKTVVIAAAWSAYGPTGLVDVKLEQTIDTLTALGAKAYVVKQVPVPGFSVPKWAALTEHFHGELSRLNISPEKYAIDNGEYENIFRRLEQRGVSILSPGRYLSNVDGTYDVIRHGRVLYFDSHHLSVAGATLLLPLFEQLFHDHR